MPAPAAQNFARTPWPPPGRSVFRRAAAASSLARTSSSPFMPSSSWSPTVHTSRYLPGGPAAPTRCAARPEGSCARRRGRGRRRRTRMLWASEPMLSSVIRSSGGAPDTITRPGSKEYSSPFTTQRPVGRDRRGAQGLVVVAAARTGRDGGAECQGRTTSRAADNMPAPCAAPDPLCACFSARAWRSLALAGFAGCGGEIETEGDQSGRRRAVQRALLRLPHARRRQLVRLQARGPAGGRRAHERAQLQRAQGRSRRTPSTRSATAASPGRSCRPTSWSARTPTSVADFLAKYSGKERRRAASANADASR